MNFVDQNLSVVKQTLLMYTQKNNASLRPRPTNESLTPPSLLCMSHTFMEQASSCPWLPSMLDSHTLNSFMHKPHLYISMFQHDNSNIVLGLHRKTIESQWQHYQCHLLSVEYHLASGSMATDVRRVYMDITIS